MTCISVCLLIQVNSIHNKLHKYFKYRNFVQATKRTISKKKSK